MDLKYTKRDKNGLISGVDYVFDDNGMIDWRKMVKPEYLYPNPSKNQICIELDKLSNFSQLTITDFNGKIILSKKILKLKTMLDVSLLPQGVYLITLDNTETITHQKLIKF